MSKLQKILLGVLLITLPGLITLRFPYIQNDGFMIWLVMISVMLFTGGLILIISEI